MIFLNGWPALTPDRGQAGIVERNLLAISVAQNAARKGS
jgi:hypothetical protein